jgi:hypothetical protein
MRQPVGQTFDAQDVDLDEGKNAGAGPNSGGQSGDTQGISNAEDTTSESVLELLEEGQYFEASVVDGIENAVPPDVSGVRTKQVPEDDVPTEYLDEDGIPQ